MSSRGYIETYANNPTDPGAFRSVTVTNGVKVTAVAFYNHLISNFHSVDKVNLKDEYVFSYQIKIMDDPDHQGPFYKC